MNKELSNLQEKLYKQVKVEEYSSCNHIWVSALQDYDGFEGRSLNYYGCIKCGLDGRVLLMKRYPRLIHLTSDQKIMYDFMIGGNVYNKGINTNMLCNLNLAKAIYSRIKEVHPDIDDETVVKYLKVALYNIRDNKVSEERKESRAKRLSLSPKFDRWGVFDASTYM